MQMKAIPIDQYPEEAWQLVMGEPLSTSKLTPLGAYKKVGLMYRAVSGYTRAIAARINPWGEA